MEVDDVDVRVAKPPFVKGPRGKDRPIKTYSFKNNDCRCSGAWVDSDGNFVCPAKAWGKPEVKFCINGEDLNLCALCVADTPAVAEAYRGHSSDGYIPTNYQSTLVETGQKDR